MIASANRDVLELREEQVSRPLQSALPEAVALELQQALGGRIVIRPPLGGSEARWEIRPRGWVGVLPLPCGWWVRCEPKIPVAGVFRMLCEVEQLGVLEMLEGDLELERLEDLLEALAGVLTGWILARYRQGLKKDYVHRRRPLQAARGRIEPVPTAQSWLRGDPALHCAFDEHSVDLPLNQVLLWTAHRLRGWRFRNRQIARRVHAVRRLLGADVSLVPFVPRDLDSLRYGPDIRDYRRMHALCRVILDCCGQEANAGSSAGVPFVVAMPQLFERWVAARLRAELGEGWDVREQVHFPLRGDGSLSFRVDLVLRERATGRVIVGDTKWKDRSAPAIGDVQQLVAYALEAGSREAWLIHPSAELGDGEVRVGGVRVRWWRKAVAGGPGSTYPEIERRATPKRG